MVQQVAEFRTGILCYNNSIVLHWHCSLLLDEPNTSNTRSAGQTELLLRTSFKKTASLYTSQECMKCKTTELLQLKRTDRFYYSFCRELLCIS